MLYADLISISSNSTETLVDFFFKLALSSSFDFFIVLFNDSVSNNELRWNLQLKLDKTSSLFLCKNINSKQNMEIILKYSSLDINSFSSINLVILTISFKLLLLVLNLFLK